MRKAGQGHLFKEAGGLSGRSHTVTSHLKRSPANDWVPCSSYCKGNVLSPAPLGPARGARSPFGADNLHRTIRKRTLQKLRGLCPASGSASVPSSMAGTVFLSSSEARWGRAEGRAPSATQAGGPELKQDFRETRNC